MYKAKINIWDMDYTDNFEKVCAYIDKKRSKIVQIKKSYNGIKQVFKKYLEATEKYSKQLTSIALELLPNSDSIEGELIQAIQGILLFNSEALNTLVIQIKEILTNINFKASKEIKSSVLEEFSKMYQTKFSQVVNLYCHFITENELYEKYLIHKELGILDSGTNIENNNNNYKDNKIESSPNIDIKKNEKLEKEKETEKGELVQNKEKIKKRKTIKEEDKKKKKIKKDNKLTKRESEKEVNGYETPKEETPKNNEIKEVMYDNHENIFKAEKEYVDIVNQTNLIIQKLVEFGYNEEKYLKVGFSNYSQNFIDKLLDCIQNQKKHYEEEKLIILNLLEKIKLEKIENFFLESQQYSLHSLSIYMNNKNYNKEDNIEIKEKGEFSNEIYKKLTIDNIGNIIKEMQANGISIKKEDLENYEREKNLEFIQNNTKLIFNSGIDLPEEEKNKIKELFEQDKDYILFFLQKLNNDRGKGGNIPNLETYNRIGDLFKFITNLTLKNDDYNCFKYILILSMTYYMIKDNEKVYIYEFIGDNPKLKTLDFWEKYLENLIKEDINNIYRDMKKYSGKKIDEKEEKFKIDFSTYSNVLSMVNNMSDFGLEKEFVQKLINIIKNKYKFTLEQLQQIDSLLMFYENTKAEDKKNVQKNNINKNDINETKKENNCKNNYSKNKDIDKIDKLNEIKNNDIETENKNDNIEKEIKNIEIKNEDNNEKINKNENEINAEENNNENKNDKENKNIEN